MSHAPKPCVISCGILRKEIEYLIASTAIDIEVHFLNEKLHMDYSLLVRGLSGALKKHQAQNPQGVVVVYGDVCLGFKGEMQELMDRHDAVKVDALNCIDCLLGGRGKLLEIDPDHKFLYLNPAFIQFSDQIRDHDMPPNPEMYKMLDGIILLEAMGDLDDHKERIDEIVERTGLPILERKNIGLGGLKRILHEALERHRRKCAGSR